MFAKLLKYEFRSSRSVLGLLTIVVLGVFLLATVAIKAMVIGAESDSDLVGIAVAAGLPVLFMAIFAIFAYAVAGEILLLVQFYKNKFTDEGYLTFTLPTDVHRIYLSSLLNMVIWQLVIAVTIIVGLVVIFLFGTHPTQFVNMEIIDAFSGEVMKEIGYFYAEELGLTSIDWVVMPLRIILSTISSVVLTTTCITLGATLSRKYKVLAAVGIYFAASCVVSVITSVVSFATTIGMTAFETSIATVMDISYALETGINVAILVGGYILSVRMLKKKLNLA